MASGWVKAFRRVERTVGGPLERAVQSDAAIAAMIRLAALQGTVQRQVERSLRFYLHLWNVPAHSDVRALAEQMARIDRRLRELSRERAESVPDDLASRRAGRRG
jgi:predicted anti-sigma-YlaC factor YlaD